MKVCILVSTYNGEKYIKEQLDSLICQEKIITHIIVRDDGSKDSTLSLIQKYKERYSDVIEVIGSGDNLGVARSFIMLLRYAVGKSYDYYFFCDQDDVWMPTKCKRAVEKLEMYKKPALYFSKKKIVDSYLRHVDVMDHINHRGSFWDCFEHSNVSGCTMCLNKFLAEEVIKNRIENKQYLHDAFIYRMAIVTNAVVIYDVWESLLYRQHNSNVVGAFNKGICDWFNRESNQKRIHYMQELMKDILEIYPNQIPDKNKELVQMIIEYDRNKKKKLALAARVVSSNASSGIKLKLIIKIISNVL